NSVSTIVVSAYGTLPNTGPNSTSDMFLIKYNSSGQGQWATRIGSATGIEQNAVLAVDPSNNVYIAGITNVASVIVYNKNTPSGGVINPIFYA
ncbi:hypothetical protein, partial [Escherichia coli]|uniref:hypothetical protein n=1 Tax=Escherichia coli TaxID=562 RepID=UPI00200F9204